MKKGIFLFVSLIFFILSIKAAYADSTVSVNVSDWYKITGETVNGIARYIVDLQRAGLPGAWPYGGGEFTEQNLTVFNYNIPPLGFSRQILAYNSSNCGMPCRVFPIFRKAIPTLIESGPGRVYIRYENTSSSYGNSADCSLDVCWNWTADFYLYPTYYIAKYFIWGNFSYILGPDSSYYFPIPYRILPSMLNETASYFSNGTYYNATLGSSSTWYTGINKSLMFVYNETGHNKTFALFSLPGGHDWPKAPRWNSYFSTVVSGIWPGLGKSEAGYTPFASSSSWWTYGMMFADSGQKSLAENETVWDGFRDQWFDIYNPASITAITGSYKGRDNITGTYNFTVNSNGLLRFNFSTSNNINHTYPVFHIKDTTSTASSYKDHIWYKNYSQSNTWQQLTNYTDFVIQDGNSTYFGYNYTLLLINKTLGSDYEFWISNSTEPVPPQYFDSSVNSTLNGTTVEFRLRWTDNVGLSGYIFSFDNCTGSLSNITEGSLSGTEDWANITRVINDTLGCTIRWKVYANDTSNNWNASSVYSFVTSLALTTMNLSFYEVWWDDSVTAYGIAFDNQGNPVPDNTGVNLTISNRRCNNVTDSSGSWQCRFNAPNELGTYTVYARIGNILINTTSLTVKPKYGKTPIGKIERIVYEEPMMIQEPSGRIRIAWVRIMIWRG